MVECKDDHLQNRSKTITRFVEVHTPEIIEIILNMTKRCVRAATWMKQVFCSRLLDSVDRFAKNKGNLLGLKNCFTIMQTAKRWDLFCTTGPRISKFFKCRFRCIMFCCCHESHKQILGLSQSRHQTCCNNLMKHSRIAQPRRRRPISMTFHPFWAHRPGGVS